MGKRGGPGFDARFRPAEDQILGPRYCVVRSERGGAEPEGGRREASPEGGAGGANDARQKRGARSVVGRFRLSPHVYDADSTPGTFSFPLGEPSPTLSIYGNRNGLNVYSGYLAGSFFKFDPNIRFHSQFALERNDSVDRRVESTSRLLRAGGRLSYLS